MAHVVKIYRIRRKKDGLFSTGGVHPSFSKKGKIWHGLGPLKNHLTVLLRDHLIALRCLRNPDHHAHDRFKGYSEKFVYEDCELIEYLLEEKENQVSSLMDIF